MTCPNCGFPFPEGHHFCSLCSSAAAPRRRGSHWPPVIIMTVMFAIGLSLFLFCSADRAASDNTPSISISASTDTPWFWIEENILHFDPSCYTGGSELTIPDTVDGQAVLALSDYCFNGCNELTTVILPYGLQEIGDGSFSGCSALRGIYIPENVTQIGDSAFAGCPKLEAIWLPYTLAQIGTDAFLNCENLEYVFFTGNYEAFKQLYPGISELDAYFSCVDGIYFQ